MSKTTNKRVSYLLGNQYINNQKNGLKIWYGNW